MADSSFDIFKQILTRATVETAIAAFKEINKLHKEFPDPEKRDYKDLGRSIDKAAVEVMQEIFETQPHFYIEIKGSEGRKDTRRDGIESPDLYGSYGSRKGTNVEIVNDAVEGTFFASRNIPGATSVLAATLDQRNGLMQTGNFDYMSKLFGPPELRGKISLDFSPLENYKIALDQLKIKDPSDLGVVILDRPRNQFEKDSAKQMGLTVILISGGDLIPALLASGDPAILSTTQRKNAPENIKALIMIGSGGWEEGIIAAAGAKALGGFAQAKIYSEDKEIIEQAKILEIDDMIPAQRSSILVSATPITDDPWFGVSGVSKDLKAKTITITEKGIEV